MKDHELRGKILQKFYEVRHSQNDVNLVDLAGWFPEIGLLVIDNICNQLNESGLIKWQSLRGNQDIFGRGKITSVGVDVIEGKKTLPVGITFHNYHIESSSNVQIGAGNIQHADVDIGKLIAAVDHSNVSESEKQKAKSILQSLLENPIIQAVWSTVIGVGS